MSAVYSADITGAAEIYIVDRVPSRLDLVREHCVTTPINFRTGETYEGFDEARKG